MVFAGAARYNSLLQLGLMLLLPAIGSTADEPVPPKVSPFPLTDVRLANGPLTQAMGRDGEYLLALDNDRLLYAFRVNAGLPTPGTPLGGWENPASEVRGHFVGHYLSACALMYASTGDARFRDKSAALVAELGTCQDALGDGYLAGYSTSLFDRLETGQPVWAVYYTVHKMMAGLLDQYTLCGNQTALDIAKRMAAYFKKRCDRFTTAEELRVQLDKNEEGGIAESLWNLYALTYDPDVRALADKIEKRSFLDPLALGQDNLARRHGNTHIPLAIGAARRFELTGEERYLYAAQFFWDRVVTARSFATGGSTDHEMWGEPFQLADSLNDTNHETCKTYNMLKLTRQLFCLTGDSRYAEYYERAFLNGILGTIGPEPGQFEYYVPQQTGYRRVFGTAYDSFWCCYGTGIETFAKLADSIYFHDASALYVNLFLPSRVRWDEQGIELEQEGDVPAGDGIALTVHAAWPTRFTLKIRRPAWLAGSPSLRVNDEAVDASSAPYLVIDREWRDGDRVDVTLPAALHTWPLPDDPSSVAIMYGPLVLAGIVDDSDADQPRLTEQHLPAQPDADRTPRMYFTARSVETDWLRPVAGERLRFRAEEQPWPLLFKPFKEIVSERYGLYWPVLPLGSDRRQRLDEENAALALLARIERAATTGDLERLEQEAITLTRTSGAAAYRARLDLALAKGYVSVDAHEIAARLVEPYVKPFVGQSRAEALWAVMGKPAASFENIQPIVADSDTGDSSYKVVEREGRPGLATDIARARRFIYFLMPPNTPLQGMDQTVRITVDYYTAGTPGRFAIEYDAVADAAPAPYTAAPAIEYPLESGWHRVVVECPHATLNGRQNHGAALRVSTVAGDDVVLGDLRVSGDPQVFSPVFEAFESAASGALDSVMPGDQASESAHNLRHQDSGAGQHLGCGYRHGLGWFSYDLKVLPDAAMDLVCIYWGPDTGREFDIEVDGTIVATQRLEQIGGPGFVAVPYAIQPDLTRDKDKITVRFIGKNGTLAGGLFGCCTKPAQHRPK